MSKGAIGCGVIVLIALVLLTTGVGSYNRLVELDEGVDNSWGQVENVYQRRADLIPNLVATVKGAADFEKDTFTQVTEARAKVGQMKFENAPDASQLAEFEAAQSQLSSALSRLLGGSKAASQADAMPTRRSFLAQAALGSAKLRFRPILMTAFAFILGVTPLVRASGAGAEGRKVMGMTVFAGMLIATMLAVCLIPVLFVAIEKLGGKKARPPEDAVAGPAPSRGGGH